VAAARRSSGRRAGAARCSAKRRAVGRRAALERRTGRRVGAACPGGVLPRSTWSVFLQMSRDLECGLEASGACFGLGLGPCWRRPSFGV